MSRKPQRNPKQRKSTPPSATSSWDPVANWYSRWVGEDGSQYHRRLAIPAVLELLDPKPHETIVDIGCGSGVLAGALPSTVRYVGIDASPRLLDTARRRYSGRAFLQADATRLPDSDQLRPKIADAAVFLLSIQDMDPLSAVLTGASWLLKRGGRLVILMFHPCFRIPRQSGWGWDEGRALQYRRVDSYMTHRAVPVRPIARGKPGSIKAYHRPLEAYINGLAGCGLTLTRLTEVPAYPGIVRKGPKAKAENRANEEIPLFLGLCAVKH